MLEQCGSPTLACAACGIARSTAYARRSSSLKFADQWREAVKAYHASLYERTVLTADLLGAGQFVEEVGPDGEPTTVLDISKVNPGVNVRMLEKLEGLRERGLIEQEPEDTRPVVLKDAPPELRARIDAEIAKLRPTAGERLALPPPDSIKKSPTD